MNFSCQLIYLGVELQYHYCELFWLVVLCIAGSDDILIVKCTMANSAKRWGIILLLMFASRAVPFIDMFILGPIKRDSKVSFLLKLAPCPKENVIVVWPRSTEMMLYIGLWVSDQLLVHVTTNLGKFVMLVNYCILS